MGGRGPDPLTGEARIFRDTRATKQKGKYSFISLFLSSRILLCPVSDVCRVFLGGVYVG